MGSRAVVIVCRDEQAARERFGVDDGRDRHRLHPHRPAVLQRRRPGAAVPRPGAGGADRRRPLGEAGHDWACLDCELMPWSAKAQELLRDPVRGGRGRGLGLAAPGGRRRWSRPAGGWTARSKDKARADRGRVPPPGAGRRPVRRRLPAVLLAGRVADRPEAGPVPPAGHRGARPHRQGPPLAHGDAGRGLPGRPRAAAGDSVQGRGRDRPGEPGGGHRAGGRS